MWTEVRSKSGSVNHPRDAVPNPAAAAVHTVPNPAAAAPPSHVFDDAPAPSAGFVVSLSTELSNSSICISAK
jgi:hypothetical protein